MGIAADCIAAGVILIFVIIFTARGFVKSVLQSLKIIISVIAGFLLKNVFFKIYESAGLLGKISGKISESAKSAAASMETVSMEELVGKMKIPSSFKDKILESAMKQEAATGEKLFAQIGDKVGKFTVNCMSFLTGFVICLIIILLLIKASSIVKKLPVIGLADRILGMALGLVTGVCIVYLAILLIYTISAGGALTGAAEAIDESKLAKYIYETGLFTKKLWK